MRASLIFFILLLAGHTLANTNSPANSGQPVSDAVNYFNQSQMRSHLLSDGYATVNGATYHYVTAGEGPLVIFYHGFPSFWYAWKYQLGALAQHYRVVAIDGLGSNLSDKPAAIERYRIDKLAQDLNQFALQVGGNTPFTLIGHDWGGSLAWAFAQGYPERLNKLVVLNAPPYNIFQELLRNNEQQQKTSTYMDFLKHPWGEAILAFNDSYLISSMAYQKHVDHERINEKEAFLFRQALSRPNALHSAINWYRANTADNLESNMDWPKENPTIKIPTMLIWGEKDKAFVPEFLEMLPSITEQLTIKKLPDAAHWPGLSHPAQVNREILEFLAAP